MTAAEAETVAKLRERFNAEPVSDGSRPGSCCSARHVAPTVTDYLVETIDSALIDRWPGQRRPLILCESRAMRGVLTKIAYQYGCMITASGGQCGRGGGKGYFRPGRRSEKAPQALILAAQSSGRPLEEFVSRARDLARRSS